MPRGKRARDSGDSGGAEPAVHPAAKPAKIPKDSEADDSGKKPRIHHPSHQSAQGGVLTVGQGDVGQLGLGAGVLEAKRPRAVSLGGGERGECVQVVAGGMHSACLTRGGQVWTFGCNDEGALGRVVEDDEEGEPGEVTIGGEVVHISAGDSHTAAVTADGRVFAWGTFRDINGPIGLVKPKVIERLPVEIPFGKAGPMVKVASGNDHLICLSLAGMVYSMGCADSGQLGRIPETFSTRETRRGGLVDFLNPCPLRLPVTRTKRKFSDVWAIGFSSFAKEAKTNKIFSWGLNNYYQLGQKDMINRFFPSAAPAFHPALDWQNLAGGDHHTVGLAHDGTVFCVGRGTYGQLGVGKEDAGESQVLRPVAGPLAGQRCVDVGAGSSVTFAVTAGGRLYGWGMGSNHQLGTGREEDEREPVAMEGKQLAGRHVLGVCPGGQHTVLLAADNEPDSSKAMDTS